MNLKYVHVNELTAKLKSANCYVLLFTRMIETSQAVRTALQSLKLINLQTHPP